MPTYEYACKDCGQHIDVVQSFHDDALTTCPSCQGNLRKVFSAAGIIFKGSGWHIKDYANKDRVNGSNGTAKSSDRDSAGESNGSTKSNDEESATKSSDDSAGKRTEQSSSKKSESAGSSAGSSSDGSSAGSSSDESSTSSSRKKSA